jgi:cytosine/adenosine deaminase-related metal-dependent hydrolase
MWFRQGLLKAVAALSCTSVVNCSKLLSGGTIIAFNETTADLQVIRSGSLLLTGDRIISIFNTSSPPNLPSDIEVIDCTERIITPGFIDTHRHGWQTVYKTLGSNTTLAEYLLRYGQFVSASYFTPEDVYISQLTGIYETLAAGVTTILDHAHHTWTPEHSAAGLNASIDSGARVFFAYAFQNSSAEFGVPEQIEQWKELASGMKGNLTQLAISYDGWTGNPTGADTKSIVDLMQYEPPLCFFNG